MSVIIRGMKMPKNCTECLFFIKSNSPKYPFVDCKIIGRLGSVFNCIGIPVDCPLVELPPHGRLIDADALRQSMYHEAFETDSPMQKWDSGCWVRYKMFERLEGNAPTIIEEEVNK